MEKLQLPAPERVYYLNERLLEAQNLSVSFGERTLFHIARLAIAAGEHIGLIGPNGSGKSTLMQVLAGLRKPDAGQVQRLCTPAYAPQFGLGDGSDSAASRKTFGVRGLHDPAQCSGGELARLRLSRVPFGSRLLMLDEPTANLDAEGQRLFSEKLLTQETFLLISHDRALLNRVCNRIWFLTDGEIRVYRGNYDAFEAAREREKLTQERAHEEYITEKRRLEEAVQSLHDQSASVRKAPKRMGNSEARLHKMGGQNAKKRLDQRRKATETRLEHLEKVERVKELPAIQLDFSLTNPPRSATILQVHHLRFAYPGGPEILRDVHFSLRNGDKAALLGSNGCGKTTLLSLLASGHEAVRITPQAKLGFLNQNLSTLDENATVLENARKRCVQREDVLRTVLTRMLLPKESWAQRAALLSGGEKIKLCLCQLILSDCNVLVLDEPTNYLDLPSLRALEAVLTAYPGTVLMVSHDEAFVRHVATRLLRMEQGCVTAFDGTLDDFEQQERSAAQPQAEALQRSALQMRMTELIGRIATASAREKPALEAAYEACLREYRELKQ